MVVNYFKARLNFLMCSMKRIIALVHASCLEGAAVILVSG